MEYPLFLGIRQKISKIVVTISTFSSFGKNDSSATPQFVDPGTSFKEKYLYCIIEVFTFLYYLVYIVEVPH